METDKKVITHKVFTQHDKITTQHDEEDHTADDTWEIQSKSPEYSSRSETEDSSFTQLLSDTQMEMVSAKLLF